MGYPEAQYAVDEVSQLLEIGLVPIVKSIQRGVTTKAGTITIGEVNVEKSVLSSVSKGSAGTVAATGNISLPKRSISGTTSIRPPGNYGEYKVASSGSATISGTLAAGTATLSGGKTDLIVKLYSAVLTNSTTITCDGPVEWQLVEYY